jgi:predicted transcriptional regulator
MPNIKTAISVRQSLFEQADSLAREMQVSRSRLFVLALEDYIRHHQNRELLAKINEAYEGEPDPDEGKRLRKMRRLHRKVVEGEW